MLDVKFDLELSGFVDEKSVGSLKTDSTTNDSNNENENDRDENESTDSDSNNYLCIDIIGTRFNSDSRIA
jgi:hypothetical protein